ncbi:MAG: SMC-Scp complex subunit ScpB [Chthoniobacteraceae bacterium]
MLLKEIIEALVFASNKPLTVKEILAALRGALSDADDEPVREAAKLRVGEVKGLIQELRQDYDAQGRAFQLMEQADGWTFVTRKEYAVWIRQLYPESKPTRLSGPALETLAIIAYRQPLTRADIEAVRGVAVDGVMQSLVDRGLVRISGRAEVPGRPLLYETTQVFMQHFGLKSLDELPNVEELRRVKLPTATPPATGELFPSGAVAEEAQPEPAAPSEPEAPAIPAEEPSPEPETLPEPPAAPQPIVLPEFPGAPELPFQDHADTDPQEN